MQRLNLLSLLAFIFWFQFINAQELKPIPKDQLFPWCIVAYDTPERTPEQRIELLKEFGFQKYAYDWRDRHVADTEKELRQATENNIEVISVWFWLNAKRDSIGKLSPANEKIFNTVKNLKLKTTFWVSMSENFFKEKSFDASLAYATKMIAFISKKAKEIGCEVALYNHGGWFGNPYNEVEIVKALPEYKLSLVYNFHHGKAQLNEFEMLFKKITPYLSAVNLNGMDTDSPKIYPLGKGSYEKKMIYSLQKNGFNGPWGILGHIENVDVKYILEKNLEGLHSLQQ